MCSSASYRIITKTPILGAQAQIYSHFSKYKSRCNFKYISENYIKIWLKVNIPFSLKEVYLNKSILNKSIFRTLLCRSGEDQSAVGPEHHQHVRTRGRRLQRRAAHYDGRQVRRDSPGVFTPDTNEALSASDLHVKLMQIHDRHPEAQFAWMTWCEWHDSHEWCGVNDTIRVNDAIHVNDVVRMTRFAWMTWREWRDSCE